MPGQNEDSDKKKRKKKNKKKSKQTSKILASAQALVQGFPGSTMHSLVFDRETPAANLSHLKKLLNSSSFQDKNSRYFINIKIAEILLCQLQKPEDALPYLQEAMELKKTLLDIPQTVIDSFSAIQAYVEKNSVSDTLKKLVNPPQEEKPNPEELKKLLDEAKGYFTKTLAELAISKKKLEERTLPLEKMQTFTAECNNLYKSLLKEEKNSQIENIKKIHSLFKDLYEKIQSENSETDKQIAKINAREAETGFLGFASVIEARANNNNNEALSILNDYLKENFPNGSKAIKINQSAYAEIADIYISQKKYVKAFENIKAIINPPLPSPTGINFIISMLDIIIKKGSPTLRLDANQEAGHLLTQAEQYEKALPYLKTTLATYPNETLTLVFIIETLSALNRVDEALKHSTTLIDNKVNLSATDYYRHATLLSYCNRKKDALQFLEEACKRNSSYLPKKKELEKELEKTEQSTSLDPKVRNKQLKKLKTTIENKLISAESSLNRLLHLDKAKISYQKKIDEYKHYFAQEEKLEKTNLDNISDKVQELSDKISSDYTLAVSFKEKIEDKVALLNKCIKTLEQNIKLFSTASPQQVNFSRKLDQIRERLSKIEYQNANNADNLAKIDTLLNDITREEEQLQKVIKLPTVAEIVPTEEKPKVQKKKGKETPADKYTDSLTKAKPLTKEQMKEQRRQEKLKKSEENKKLLAAKKELAKKEKENEKTNTTTSQTNSSESKTEENSELKSQREFLEHALKHALSLKQVEESKLDKAIKFYAGLYHLSKCFHALKEFKTKGGKLHPSLKGFISKFRNRMLHFPLNLLVNDEQAANAITYFKKYFAALLAKLKHDDKPILSEKDLKSLKDAIPYCLGNEELESLNFAANSLFIALNTYHTDHIIGYDKDKDKYIHDAVPDSWPENIKNFLNLIKNIFSSLPEDKNEGLEWDAIRMIIILCRTYSNEDFVMLPEDQAFPENLNSFIDSCLAERNELSHFFSNNTENLRNLCRQAVELAEVNETQTNNPAPAPQEEKQAPKKRYGGLFDNVALPATSPIPVETANSTLKP